MKSSASGEWIANRFEPLEVLRSAGDRRVWRMYDHVKRNQTLMKAAPGRSDSPAVDALRWEYELLASMSSPGTARAGEFGWCAFWPECTGTESLFFFTQELLIGDSLAALRGQMQPADLKTCFGQVLRVLAQLQARGIFDLDLKPEHILRTIRGWCLIDLEPDLSREAWEANRLAGVARYLAPERLAGERPDPRADLYSLGVIGWEVLSGQRYSPTLSSASSSSPEAWSQRPPPLPEAVTARDPGFFAWLERLYAAQPAARFSDALAALEALDGLTPDPLPLPEVELIGRGEQLEALARQLEQLSEQRCGTTLNLEGPVGSGRSRLLRAFEVRAVLAGYHVLHLTVGDYPAAPFSTVQRLLDCLTRLQVSLTSASSGRNAGGRSEDSDLPLEERGTAMLACLCQTGAALLQATGRPMVLLLDDPDWIDEPSRRILQQLGLRTADAGLVLVSLAGLASSSATVSTFALPPLDPDQIRQLCETCLGPGILTADRLAVLCRISGGWPGSIRAALEVLRRDPGIDLRELTFTGEDSLINARLNALSASTLALARPAAVFTGPFSRQDLENLLKGLPTGAGQSSESDLWTLLDQGILQPAPGSGQEILRLVFTDERIRLELYARIEPNLCMRLHQRAAALLQRRLDGDPGAWELSVARHHAAAGNNDSARHYYHAALKHANLAGFRSEVLELLDTLLTLEDDNAFARADLLLRRGELLFELERRADAVRDFSAVRQLADDAATSARALAGLARCSGASGEPDEAARLWREALRVAAEGGVEASLRVTWWQRLAALQLGSKAYDEAAFSLAQARAIDHQPRSRTALQRLRYEAWLALERHADCETLALLITRLEEAIEESDRQGYHRHQHTLMNTLAEVLFRAGRDEEGDVRLRELVLLSRRRFDLSVEASATYNLGRRIARQGHPRDARALFERAAALNARLGNTVEQARALSAQAELLLDEGRSLETARGLLDQAFALFEGPPPIALRGALEVLRLRLQLKTGEHAGVGEELERLYQELHQCGELDTALGTLLDHLEQLVAGGRNLEAWQLASIPAGWPQHELDPNLRNRLHDLAARCHLVLSNPTGRPLRQSREIDLEWIDRFSTLLEAVHDEHELASRLAGQLGALVQGTAHTFLFDRDNIQVAGGTPLSRDRLEQISRSLLHQVRQSGAPLEIEDTFKREEVENLTARTWQNRCLVCQPIRFGAEVIGALYVEHPNPGALLSTENRRLITRVGEVAGQLLKSISRSPESADDDLPAFDLIGTSAAIRELRRKLFLFRDYRQPRLTILLIGERGTGKSRIAKHLHALGRRADRSFGSADIARLPESTLESELFGHKRGAFTGAITDRKGALEAVNGGTFFLDEIAEAPPSVQAKLLTLFQERTIRRMGEDQDRAVDLDFIVATNRNLREEVEKGRFRADLLDRLWQHPIRIPSLRERGREDIQALIQHFLIELQAGEGELQTGEGALQGGAAVPQGGARQLPGLEHHFTTRALHFLYNYSWPGNVRELENLLKNVEIVQTLASGKPVDLPAIEEHLLGGEGSSQSLRVFPSPQAVTPPPAWTWKRFSEWIEELQTAYVQQALDLYKGNVQKTAQALDCERGTLYRYVPAARPRRDR